MRVGINRGWLLRWATVWCALAFVALQFVGMHQEPPFNDSYRYGMATLTILGVSAQDAHDQNVQLVCKRVALADERSLTLDPTTLFTQPSQLDSTATGCVSAFPHPNTYWPVSPRYVSIFDSRPGFPLLMAPIVKVFGLERGMFVTSWLLGAAGGLVTYLLLRLASAPRGAALAGQLLFYSLPIGYWAGRTLTEGPMLLTTLATVVGGWLLLQSRIGLGIAITAGAGLAGFLVKYSQVTILSVALLGAAAAIWLFDRQRRHLGTALLAAASTIGLAVSMLVPRLMGWPGFRESLQDTFTDHFHHPDVADPWYRLAVLNKAYWTEWLGHQATRPLLLIATIVGTVALWRWQRSLALLVLAAGLTGVATEIAHPVWAEQDRLYAQVWLIAVVGLPLLFPLILRRLAPDWRGDDATAE